MAGSQNKAEQLAICRDELQKTRDALADLQKRVALKAPHILDDDKPKPITSYSPRVCDSIQALAEQGRTEAQWVADLGLDQNTWEEWGRTYPELRAAVSRARSKFRAHLDELAMNAITRGGYNIPRHVFDLLKDSHDPQALQADAAGDASKLVLIDLRCEACAKG